MASTTTLSLGALINDAMNVLYRANERPAQVTIGANALDTDTDTTFTLSSSAEWDQVHSPMIVENGQELLLVTAKSADATPVFTAARGYAGTPAAAAATGSTILVEPQWSRRRVRDAILRAFRRPLAAWLPAVATSVIAPATGKAYFEVPANTIDVLRVGYVDATTGGWFDLDGWDFVDDAGGASSTGKLVTLHPQVQALTNVASSLYITRQTPYVWSGGTAEPAEAETVAIPLGAEDLPSLYAAAYVMSNRELTRAEIDKSEEWTQEASIRQGTNIRMVSALWGEFYRALDEARRIQNVPRRIRYRKRRIL